MTSVSANKSGTGADRVEMFPCPLAWALAEQPVAEISAAGRRLHGRRQHPEASAHPRRRPPGGVASPHRPDRLRLGPPDVAQCPAQARVHLRLTVRDRVVNHRVHPGGVFGGRQVDRRGGLGRVHTPAAPGLRDVNHIGEQPHPHRPVEVADRAPVRREVADPVEQRPSDQQLGRRDVNRAAQQMQQSVKRCPADVGAVTQTAAAFREHRFMAPPVIHAPIRLAVFVDRLQRAMGDVAVRMGIERRGKPGETVRCHRVVTGGDVDVFARRRLQTRRPTARRTGARSLPGAHPWLVSGALLDVLRQAPSVEKLS